MTDAANKTVHKAEKRDRLTVQGAGRSFQKVSSRLVLRMSQMEGMGER